MRSSISVAIVCMTYDPDSNLTVLLRQQPALANSGVPYTSNITHRGDNLNKSASFDMTSQNVGDDIPKDCPPILDEELFLIDLNDVSAIDLYL